MQDDAFATRLLPALQRDLERWRAGEEIDFQRLYEAPMRDIGPVRVVVELFLRFEGTVLSDALNATGFLWQDLAFAAWREILRSIGGRRQAVYEFVWFAAQFLGLDVLAMIDADPDVDDAAKASVRTEFPSRAPRAGSAWERETMAAVGIDAVAMWRRLAAEGAPMRVDFAALDK